MANPINSGGEDLACSKTAFHCITVKPDFLVFTRRFPPKKLEIRYNEIASVEHKRLVDYGLLIGVLVPLLLAYAFNTVDAIKKIVEALLTEVSAATSSSTVTTASAASVNSAITLITYFLVFVGGFYAVRFIMSFGQRLVVYRSGKNPIAVPMNLTGDAMSVLVEINKKVKEVSGMSKEEVEKFIGEQIRTLLDERSKMQEDLVSMAKEQLKTAKTAEEKQRVKQIVKEGVDKLKAQDEVIDRELRKKGLSKEDLFKKYRIKPPGNEFIDSVLQSEGVE